ncbi:leucyl aminopeptidase [Mycolicibacterium monacense]|uniref:Probable cytosol aminopeptidase n=2 Tax=unclassified Mycobacterium TaxID=2642494 RepID=AMPA_MYCSK|nr:leucyl aminopeptidase [Mycolicibacterium monacense]A1UIA8.1 RecName: Full=Probable cytosol aminopeptidase; AltName: Full=Leucine aminopeptidase; Short=LAP; AltName: Full=Leucyl aminopeptidase [Mycobacterium sp. KMS]Q1B6R7.1 RecName: Full=Probable cytosol aminopeptidase; AltName: Full=Leucine aminopeptidase; Short=LAP; AltName: Full=Leucyl aminopeptidase [Mycobacterium sp. MCS]OBF52283.1 leucyl aminopeptidase [Mycolicibacterium monacense]
MSSDPGYQAPVVTVSSSIPRRGVGDSVLIVPVVTRDDAAAVLAAAPFLDKDAVREIEAALKSLGATGGEGQTHRLVVSALPVASVLTIGLGKERDEWPADTVRRVAGNAARSLDKVAAVLTTLSALDLEAAIEGLILGSYRFTEFRSAKTAPKDGGLRAITALSQESKSRARDAAQRATDIATAVATARDFVNTPPSHLYPDEFAKRAKALGEAAGLEVEILDDKALVKAGYGGIVGVGKGSSRPPRLVRLSHKGAVRTRTRGARPGGSKRVALVGKGITFDTGGISIKPAANMHHMTSDMGGAAAVIATVVLAAKQKLPIDVIATVPMAENMPSATAQRPGDVLTQYGGTTVEVLNTDAEGRLILADAIVRACEDNPDYLIETSTLTGAQTVALGSRTPGVMGSDAFRDRVATLSQQVGENAWAMPLPEELKDDLKSTVADLANVSGSRFAGMLVAGTYLREFVADGVEWAHIDVAAPAYNSGGPWGYTPKGGTGVPTRTMFAVLEEIAREG